MLKPKYLDDGYCAVCAEYILREKMSLPFNQRDAGPYFCSEECVEQVYGLSVPVEKPWEPPDPEVRWFEFQDGKIERRDSRRGQRYLASLEEEHIETDRKYSTQIREHREWSFNCFIEDYRNAKIRNKYDEEKAKFAALEEELRERAARHIADLEKQRVIDEKAAEKQREQEEREAEKEEQRRVRDEEREAERLRRQEERETERLLREEEKLRLKEEERLRKKAEERERLRPIPFTMPSDHSRFEGVHILGAAGSGKTTLIQEFIKHDIGRLDSPGLIVIDPKGTLIDRVRALRAIPPRRLVVIDATHQYPAKLGLFAKSNVPGVDPEQVIAQAVSTYKYIFQTTSFSFTPKQGILFEYVVRFMFEIGGTLSTLIQFLRTDFKKPHEFERHYDGLPDDMQEFFKIDLKDSYEGTAKEIGVRLQQIRQKPTLRAMFDTTERRVDLFDCMQKGKIVLVNTGMSRDQASSQMIGRFIIAMVLNATYVRALMPKAHWHPTFLMIDEFQEFVDAEKTPEMLRKIREYNVGVMMAHHNMYGAELDDAMRVAISTNTSAKYCADPRGMDLSYMARDFDCDPSYLRAQQVNDTHVRFAHVMRRVHDTPVSVIVPRGNLNQYLTWDAQTLAMHDQANTALVHGSISPPAPTPPPTTSIPPTPAPVVPKQAPQPKPTPPPSATNDPDGFA